MHRADVQAGVAVRNVTRGDSNFPVDGFCKAQHDVANHARAHQACVQPTVLCSSVHNVPYCMYYPPVSLLPRNVRIAASSRPAGEREETREQRQLVILFGVIFF